MKRILGAILCTMTLSLGLAACSQAPTGNPPGTTDEMWSDAQSAAVLEVFIKDGRAYTVEYEYEIPELAGYDELEEGKHYKVTADVTLLNGGVAGYVDYPQVERIIGIEEIEAAD